jgi:ribosomal protein L6P/L9E
MSNKKIVLWSVIVLIAIAVCIFVYYKYFHGEQVQVTINASADGKPAVGAVISIEGEKYETDQEGETTALRQLQENDTIVVIARWNADSVIVGKILSKEEWETKQADVNVVFHRPIPPPPPEPKGVLVIETVPQSGVLISIDGVSKGEAPMRDTLSIGKHTLHASKNGYAPKDSSIDVGKETLKVRVKLRQPQPVISHQIQAPPQKGKLKITTDPAGADVIIDGKHQNGKTPLTITSEYGQHSVEVKLNNKTLTEHPTINGPRQALSFPRFPDSPPTGTLDLSSEPSGAHVIIDNKPFEEVTPTKIPLERGKHQILVSDGSKTDTSEVTINPNETIIRKVFIDDCLKLANKRFKEKQYDEVENILASCDPKKLPGDKLGQALYLRGMANYLSKKYQNTITILHDLVDQYDKTNAMAFYYIGLSEDELGQYEAAILAYTEVIRHEIKIPKLNRDEIMGNVKFNIAWDYYLLYIRSTDPDVKSDYLQAALRDLRDFVAKYCEGVSTPNKNCSKARGKIKELEKL